MTAEWSRGKHRYRRVVVPRCAPPAPVGLPSPMARAPYDLDGAAYVIGRLILAVADRDEDEVRRCIRQYDEWELGSVGLITDVAMFGAGAAELLKGNDWRTTVTSAVHRLEIELLLRYPPDDPRDGARVPARI